MIRWKSWAAAAALVPLLAAGAASAATLNDLELGDHWTGASWDKESLKDRTVVVEFWGLN